VIGFISAGLLTATGTIIIAAAKAQINLLFHLRADEKDLERTGL